MLRRGRVGARRQPAVVGHVCVARERLLPCNDEIVAILDGARLDIGEVGARFRLAVTDEPRHLAAADLRQQVGLLRFRAEAIIAFGM